VAMVEGGFGLPRLRSVTTAQPPWVFVHKGRWVKSKWSRFGYYTHTKLKITLTPLRDFQLGVSVIFNMRGRFIGRPVLKNQKTLTSLW